MGYKFNPFSGNFDLAGGGGDAAPFAGQVDAYADLPLDSTAALNSRWLVKNNSGTWPFSTYKQAGIYIRVNTVGASRDTDYQFVGTLPSVMNDNEFLIYDDADATRNLKFNVGANVPTASTVTLTAPGASGTLGWLQSVSSITVSTTHQLTAARNQRVRVNSTNIGSGAALYLPSTGNAEGDRLEVACVGLTAGTLGVRTGQNDYTVSTSMGLNEQRTFIYSSGAWTLGSVESHTHSGLGPTFASSAFQVTEPSGLATNRLAFSLSGITAGATRTLTVPDASGRIQVEGQPIGNTTAAAGTFTTLAANNGTLTASAPVLDLSQTWNNSGVTFTGMRFNAAGTSDANSAAASLLADFQVGGTSRLAVRKDGSLAFGNGNISIFTTGGGASLGTVAGGTAFYTGSAFQVNNIITTSNANTIQFGSPAVTSLIGEAAETLAQRRATNPQTFRIYNTFTDASNHERLSLRWASNVAIIGTEAGGTGSARALEFQTGGVTRMTVGATGLFTVNTTGSGNNTLTLDNLGFASTARAVVGAGGPHGQTIIFDPRGISGQPTINCTSNPAWLHIQTGAVTRLSIGPSDFNLTVPIIRIGGTDATFPALKRSSTTLQVRLANDSAFAPFECAGLTLNGDLTASTRNIVTDTTTGTKIGTATDQKIGFWSATPVVQQAAVADATDAATTQARLNDLLARVRTLGLIAT